MGNSIAGYYSKVFFKDVVHGATDAASAALDVRGFVPVGIVRTSTDTTLASTDLPTFQISVDGTNYYAVYTAAATQLSIDGTEQVYSALNPDNFRGANYIKVVLSKEAAGDQTFRVALSPLE